MKGLGAIMSKLEELAKISGISPEYIDKTGQTHYTTDDVRRCFLKDMGYKTDSESELDSTIKKLDERVWKDGFDYVNSFFADETDTSIKLYISETDKNSSVSYELENEQGEKTHGEISLSALPIEESKNIDGTNFVMVKAQFFTTLTPGYYQLRATINNKTFETMIIMALPKCYLEEGIAEETFRVYGLAIQLYALRSKNNMGIGDFTDLKNIIKLVAKNGGDVVGVNPLGASFPESRDDVSPYRILTRAFLNYAYIDLKAVPEYEKSAEVQSLISTPEIKEQIEHLRSVDKVDYLGVYRLKIKLLKAMYTYFKQEHLNPMKGLTPRGMDFKKFVASKGKPFANTCLFEAILEKHNENGMHNDWRFWPNNYDKINSFHTRDFEQINQDLIQFYAYCHWLADQQLAEAANLCKELNMKIGLYLDSPIGAAASGVEVWENRELFAENMGIGAPADPMRPRGQSWGFAPYHPQKLRQAHYAPFISLIRENMQHAKALRIDHAMGLMRLFWVYFVENNPVVQGAYVYYNMREMVAILSIESHRAKCMVIGEDLGTVPAGFREYMYEHGLISNKVFFRQKDKDGTFLAPQKYQYLSLAQASTHDQATAYGYWLDEDINTFKACHLYVNEEQYQNNLDIRAKERALLIKAFNEQQTFPSEACREDAEAKLDGKSVPEKLEYAVNKYVARSNSAIFLQRIEDIYGQISMENVPGTIAEYPNWRIKLTIDVDDMDKDNRFKAMFDLIQTERK